MTTLEAVQEAIIKEEEFFAEQNMNKIKLEEEEEVTLAHIDEAIGRVIKYVENNINSTTGQIKDYTDLGVYAKVPMALYCSNNIKLSELVLDYIQSNLINSCDSFQINKINSFSNRYLFYDTFLTEWIIIAAYKLKKYDLVELGFNYIKQNYYDSKLKSATISLYDGEHNNLLDFLSISYYGSMCLLLNYIEEAKESAKLLEKMIEKQQDANKIYLRINNKGWLVLKDNDPFYCIDNRLHNQFYSMLGYPMTFLAKLYQITKNKVYLKQSEYFGEFALSCNGIRESHNSHIIAAGSSLLYKETKKEKYKLLSMDIISTLLKLQNQNNGLFMIDVNDKLVFNQSMEIIIWLKECQFGLFQ